MPLTPLNPRTACGEQPVHQCAIRNLGASDTTNRGWSSRGAMAHKFIRSNSTGLEDHQPASITHWAKVTRGFLTPQEPSKSDPISKSVRSLTTSSTSSTLGSSCTSRLPRGTRSSTSSYPRIRLPDRELFGHQTLDPSDSLTVHRSPSTGGDHHHCIFAQSIRSNDRVACELPLNCRV